MGRDTFLWTRMAPSNLSLNISRHGESAASLVKLCQGLTGLTGKISSQYPIQTCPPSPHGHSPLSCHSRPLSKVSFQLSQAPLGAGIGSEVSQSLVVPRLNSSSSLSLAPEQRGSSPANVIVTLQGFMEPRVHCHTVEPQRPL